MVGAVAEQLGLVAPGQRYDTGPRRERRGVRGIPQDYVRPPEKGVGYGADALNKWSVVFYYPFAHFQYVHFHTPALTILDKGVLRVNGKRTGNLRLRSFTQVLAWVPEPGAKGVSRPLKFFRQLTLFFPGADPGLVRSASF